MYGPSFRFSAPLTWTIHRSGTSASAQAPGSTTATVSAAVYRLARRYTPDRFAEAAKELDGVAAELARKAGGKVTARETTTVDGHKIRAYRFTARRMQGTRYENRVGFVLAGKREVQLLCQAPAGAGNRDGACALLFRTFRLTG